MILGLSSPLAYSSAKEWAEKHKKLGTRAINFQLTCRDSEEKVDEFVKEAKEAGLFFAEVGIWNNMLSPNKEEREKNIEYAIGQLKLADKIGAKCCVNVAGSKYAKTWDGPAKENFSKEAFNETVEVIQYVIDQAKPTNTKFAIESMPWMIPTGPDEYLKLIKAVDREAFGAHLDVVNMINSADRYFGSDDFIKECFDKLGDKILSCHLKDIHLAGYTFALREVPCGQGELNLELYAKLASEINEDMPMIIEHLHSDEEYLESLSYVKERLKDYIK